MITTKIIYDRKKKAKTEGTGTIEVRVTIARRAYYIVRVCVCVTKNGKQG